MPFMTLKYSMKRIFCILKKLPIDFNRMSYDGRWLTRFLSILNFECFSFHFLFFFSLFFFFFIVQFQIINDRVFVLCQIGHIIHGKVMICIDFVHFQSAKERLSTVVIQLYHVDPVVIPVLIQRPVGKPISFKYNLFIYFFFLF